MFSLGIVILASIVCALLGVIIGIALQKKLGSSESQLRELKAELEAAKNSKEQYQQQVAEHFSSTANLINELTFKYKDVHDHLAAGANELCRDESGQSLLAGAAIELSIESRSNHDSDTSPAPQQPLDYAPKNDAGAGTLAEDYGLEKVNLHDDDDELPDPLLASHGIAEELDDLDIDQENNDTPASSFRPAV
jgi:hypothetical protein